MHVEKAAHVDHEVTHASSVGTIGLGLAGVVVAAAIVLSAPVSMTIAGAVAVAGTVGQWGAVGMDLGKIVDGFLPVAAAGKIERGLSTVRLGPDQKHAARAFTDSITDCCNKEVAQGSLLVMLGPERRPMSRRGDQLRCSSGCISEGMDSLMVGGAPSALGQQTDMSNPIVTGMSLLFGALSLSKTIQSGAVRQSVLGGAGLMLEAAGQSDAANLANAGAIGPSTSKGFMRAVDWAQSGNTAFKGAASGVTLGSQLIP